MTTQIYPTTTVGALIFNEKSEILLIKTHKWHHKYGLPGGKIEIGETAENALIREFKEETDRILMLLEYYREYRTFFHIGLDYGLNETNVQRNIEQTEKTLLQSGYFRLQGKRILATDVEIKEVRIDVTECPAQRPKKKSKISRN